MTSCPYSALTSTPGIISQVPSEQQIFQQKGGSSPSSGLGLLTAPLLVALRFTVGRVFSTIGGEKVFFSIDPQHFIVLLIETLDPSERLKPEGLF